MTFEDYLIRNEDAIRSRLEASDDASRIRAVLDDLLGRMLIEVNESESDPFLQESAAAVTAAARSCLDLMDVYGEIRYYRGGSGSTGAGTDPGLPGNSLRRDHKTGRILFWVFFIAGIVLLCAAVFSGSFFKPAAMTLPAAFVLAAAGGVLLFFAGRQQMRSDALSSVRAAVPVAVPTYDKDRIWRSFRRICLTMDRSLSELRASREALTSGGTEAENSEGTGGAISDQEDLLMLLAGQLEALYSKDGEYALDELSQVRHYLHRHQVELSEDWQTHREWFEFVPTQPDMLLRPAMLQADSGRLLRKGLAGVSSLM